MCQIFKNKYPVSKFINFLDKITYNENKKTNIYLIDNSNYKMCQYKDMLNDFLKDLKSYYHTSKYFYIERKTTYSNFITIIRQICKSNNIPIISKILYEKSTYRMCYFIYLDNKL